MTKQDLIVKVHQDIMNYLVNCRRTRMRNVPYDVGDVLGHLAISDFLEFNDGLLAAIENIIYNENIYFEYDNSTRGDE
jgi:hypothetical protein